jgi:Kinesin motor domain
LLSVNFKESANINLSLLALQRVLVKLGESDATASISAKSATPENALRIPPDSGLAPPEQVRHPGDARETPSDPAGNGAKSCNLPHIPYRDSKLTHLLKDTLSGGRHCLLVSCVNLDDILETKSTLQYATKAKRIAVRPVSSEQRQVADDHLQSLQAAYQTLLEEYSRVKDENRKLKAEKLAGPMVTYFIY